MAHDAKYFERRRRAAGIPPAVRLDNAVVVTVKTPASLRDAARAAAKAEGITPSEWWRRAGERALAE